MVMHFFPRQIYIVRKLKRKKKDIKNNLSTSHSMQGRFIQMQLEGKHYFFSNKFILLIKQVN